MGAAVEGWGLEVAFALMMVVLGMFADRVEAGCCAKTRGV